ncbi:MAG: histidine kinase, partial [Actinomycetia bacterium]|nr:histidine kinase [Actinomycetes bacterium]
MRSAAAKHRRWLLLPILLVIDALALLPRGVQAQPAPSFDEVGRFYVQNFAPQDYGGHGQNWAIVQSPDGLIYVANSYGVLEYDGVSWRLIRTSKRRMVRSLAIDTEGRVYVGAEGELGYLAAVAPQGRRRPDALGRMSYVSLLDHVPPDDRAFADVWNIEKTSDGLYFRTRKRLFRWNGREMKVWRTAARFGRIFALRDTLYVRQPGIGLMRMDDDALALAPGGALFEGAVIRGLVPWGETAYLAVTRDRGMFRCRTRRRTEAAYRGPACSPFKPGLTELLAPLQPSHATLLPEGHLAIGTTRGGVVLLDDSGRLLRTLDETSGLRDEHVWSTYVDRQGGLWLGLNNGLARVEADTSLSYFDKTLGLRGSVGHVARH